MVFSLNSVNSGTKLFYLRKDYLNLPPPVFTRDQDATTERIFKLSPIHGAVIYPIF